MPQPELFPSPAHLSLGVLSWVWPIWSPWRPIDSMSLSMSVNQKHAPKESLYLIKLRTCKDRLQINDQITNEQLRGTKDVKISEICQ